MTFQPELGLIRWRLHLRSPREHVYRLLAADKGRARFWAESAQEYGGVIDFQFPNGFVWAARIISADPPRTFAVEYFGGTRATFLLADDGSGGTDLMLTDEGVPEAHRVEVTAGWVSVLMALKAAADFGVDLRNHDPSRTWDQGYADN
jgi:uncharacterized protein YndB with AHSA1/START domain